MLKLWENTVNQVAPEGTPKEHKLRPNLPKYGFFQHDNFSKRSFPVSKIFVLRTDNLQKDFSSNELDKLKAFNVLQQNTYRRMQVDMMQVRQSHFEIISRLTNQASVIELSRPIGGSDISSFISFIKTQKN